MEELCTTQKYILNQMKRNETYFPLAKKNHRKHHKIFRLVPGAQNDIFNNTLFIPKLKIQCTIYMSNAKINKKKMKNKNQN